MPGPRRIGECGQKVQHVRMLFDCRPSVPMEAYDNFAVDIENHLSGVPRPAWADDFPMPPQADDGPVAPRASLQMRVDFQSDLSNEKSAKVQVRKEIDSRLAVAEGCSPPLANAKPHAVEDSIDQSARSSPSAAKSRRRRLIASVSARLVRWKPPGMSWRRKPIVSNQSILPNDPKSTPVLSNIFEEKSLGPLCPKVDTELIASCTSDRDGVPDEIPLPKAKGLPAGGVILGYHATSSQGDVSDLTANATQFDKKAYSSQKLKTPRRKQDVEKKVSLDDTVKTSLALELRDVSYHADVALAVYSLNGASAINKLTEFAGLGGAYHVGIEIFCLEWSYGWCPHGTGVHNVYAGCSDLGTFKERAVLGRTPCTPTEVISILGELRDSWSGASYNLLHKNCAHFTMEFVERLQVGRFPDWVNSLPSLLRWLTEWLGTPIDQTSIDTKRVSAPANSNECDAHEAIVASELDWVEAQGYMLERAADAAHVWNQKRKAKR